MRPFHKHSSIDACRAIPFVKMVGTGNDFLIIDAVHQRVGSLRTPWARIAQAMCDRRYGVGADGLLLLEPSRIADCRMRVLNPDGSEAQMCGNGVRCVAGLVSQWPGRRSDVVSIETLGGVVTAEVRRTRVRVRMPTPRHLRLGLRLEMDHQPWRLASVDTGVPHAVAIVDRVDQVDVERVGRQLRFHRLFQPRGTNVDFVEVNPEHPRRLRIRTYERGVEGETLACGTGVTAAAVVHALCQADGRTGRRAPGTVAHQIEVETRSGETLTVSLTVVDRGGAKRVTDVTLEGAVQWVCQGVFPWSTRGRS